jgi:hypothetical protein
MVGKLTRLPVNTQKALQQFACIGNSTDTATLSCVLETASEQETEAELSEAIHQELVIRSENHFRFAHDRVQEAAYSLIPEEMRAESHLRMGRLLNAHTPAEKLEEAVFEIVSQLNRGANLIDSVAEREHAAQLNLMAAKRAKAAAAYSSALSYLVNGNAFLTDDAWEHTIPLAARFADGIRSSIGSLPWNVTQLGCRAEYRFQPEPARNGTDAHDAADPELERYLHLHALNRGVLLTPFHNMALMGPTTTAADVDRHTKVFGEAVATLV